MSPDSIRRHANKHLPPQLRAQLIAGPELSIDLDRLRETESQSLLANLVALRHRLFAGLDVAEEAGDGNMISRLAGQLHKNMELVGKLLRPTCARAASSMFSRGGAATPRRCARYFPRAASFRAACGYLSTQWRIG